MGAGASSLPPTIDKLTAQNAAGTLFNEAAFDGAAVDGVISRDEFLSAASALSLNDKPPSSADKLALVPTSASLMQCRSFLGTHSRLGAISPC